MGAPMWISQAVLVIFDDKLCQAQDCNTKLVGGLKSPSSAVIGCRSCSGNSVPFSCWYRILSSEKQLPCFHSFLMTMNQACCSRPAFRSTAWHLPVLPSACLFALPLFSPVLFWFCLSPPAHACFVYTVTQHNMCRGSILITVLCSFSSQIIPCLPWPPFCSSSCYGGHFPSHFDVCRWNPRVLCQN